MNELGNQFGSGIIVAYFLEFLKNTKYFPFLESFHPESYKKFVGCIAALITTIGIHYAFDYNTDGNGILTIVLPTKLEFFHSLTDFAKQWTFQQFAYDVAVKDSTDKLRIKSNEPLRLV